MIPDTISPATLTTEKYPSALLKALPKDESYSLLGVIAEDMLRLPVSEIVLDRLLSCAGVYGAEITPSLARSKTLPPFVDLLRTTRAKMDAVIRGELQGETEIAHETVTGHPDARTVDQIFEIKLTGQLNKNWSYFLCQVYAYAALDPTVNDVYLVLPLQSSVCHFDVRNWSKRTKFRDALVKAAQKLEAPVASNPFAAIAMMYTYNIGATISTKKKTNLTNVLKMLPDTTRPYQIFVGSPLSSKFTVDDMELATAAAYIEDRSLQIYIHAPYIINLSDPADWAVELLCRNLEVGSAMGARGVVVHVGKYKTLGAEAALESMRTNILQVLARTLPACPLLLETPAGQGTELLTEIKDFVSFVSSFNDPRLRACVDTCHVFACGHSPLDYIEAVNAEGSDLLRLVHFNDSKDACGSCKDRHAHIGSGHIGVDVLSAVAKRCLELKVPMILE